MLRKLFLSSLVIAAFLSLCFVVSVKADSLTWNQAYGGPADECAYSLVVTSDGGYAIAGYTESFGAGESDFWLVKIDAFGNMEWNHTYGGAERESAKALIVTSDGGYAMAGYTESFGAGNRDLWLVKTDGFGNMEWNSTYGGVNNDAAYSLVETSDGGYIMAGTTKSFDVFEQDAWLVKTNANGAVQWNKTYDDIGIDSASSVVETNDGGYILAGNTGGGYWGYVWLIKTDESGNMKWNQRYENGLMGSASSLLIASDRCYVIACNEAAVIKTGSSGSRAWTQTYGKSGYISRLRSIIQTADGGYAIVGFTEDQTVWSPDPDYDGHLWLIKTDESGDMQWNKTYGGPDSEGAYSLVTTSDGGYVMAGYTASFRDGTRDFWVVKTDENGFVSDTQPSATLPYTFPPSVHVYLSQNKTYTQDSLGFTFSVSKETSWMGYSLDGEDNVTLTEEKIGLTHLINGSHNITIYATDHEGNTVSSETIHFTIEKPPTTWTATETALIVLSMTAGAVMIIFFLKMVAKKAPRNSSASG